MTSSLLIASFSLVHALSGDTASSAGTPRTSPATVSLAAWRIEGDQADARLGAALAAADVNGDGFGETLPVAVTFMSDSVNFGESRHRAVHPCDLDGDAFGDVLICRRESEDIAIFVDLYHGSSNGLVAGGSFWPPDVWESNASGLLDVTDLDFDGIDDLLLQSSGRTTICRGTQIVQDGFQRAPQWFEPSISVSAYWTNNVLAKQDFDGDGFDDLLLSNLLLSNQHLHRGSPADFAREPSWFGDLGTASPGYQRGADFDGDGRLSFLFLRGGTLTVVEVTP